MGDLPVGTLRSGETVVDFEVGISGRSLASHVGIFATTGMGKSNLMMVLAGDVLRAAGRYGLLLIDPHGEYRTQLARHPWAGERLRTYAARSLPNTSSLRVGLAELTVDDLRTAYDWSRPQEEALFELERKFSTLKAGGEGLSWLLAFSQVEDLPGFRDVELGNRVALNTLQVLHRRARRIVELPCIAADSHVSVGSAVLRDLREGRVVLIDVSGLGSTEELLVASFLARRVLEEWSTAYLERSRGPRPAARRGRRSWRRPSGCWPPARTATPTCSPAWPEKAQVQGRPVRRHPAAQAARRRTAQPVQHVLHSRPGRREGPHHSAVIVEAGHRRTRS